jgi:hypothetical protein
MKILTKALTIAVPVVALAIVTITSIGAPQTADFFQMADANHITGTSVVTS